jgi:hypothetical protein
MADSQNDQNVSCWEPRDDGVAQEFSTLEKTWLRFRKQLLNSRIQRQLYADSSDDKETILLKSESSKVNCSSKLGLLSLPVEILHHIDSYLSLDDDHVGKVNLRFSSAFLFIGLKTEITKVDRCNRHQIPKHIKKLCRIWNLFKQEWMQAESQSISIATSRVLYCADCEILEPEELFNPQDRHLGNWTRQCSLRVRLCNCNSFKPSNVTDDT